MSERNNETPLENFSIVPDLDESELASNDRLEPDDDHPRYIYDYKLDPETNKPTHEIEYRWEVEEMIGEGGYSKVYRAYDTKLDLDVAVKMQRIPDYWVFGADHLRKEGRTTASLSHPTLATIYEVLEQDSFEILIQEYIEGPTLQEIINSGEEETLDKAQYFAAMRDLADGVSYLREHGIEHRDIKPKNLILGTDGLKIVDFGIAMAHEEMVEGDKYNTSAYAADEVLSGSLGDERSDVFTVGRIALDFLVDKDDRTKETNLISGLSRQERDKVYEVLRKATSEDPKKRYQNTSQFVQAFQLALNT